MFIKQREKLEIQEICVCTFRHNVAHSDTQCYGNLILRLRARACGKCNSYFYYTHAYKLKLSEYRKNKK